MIITITKDYDGIVVQTNADVKFYPRQHTDIYRCDSDNDAVDSYEIDIPPLDPTTIEDLVQSGFEIDAVLNDLEYEAIRNYEEI